MLISILAFFAFAISAVSSKTGSLSFLPPIPLVEDWHRMSQAAGLAQQAYCTSQPSNQQVGDAHVLYSHGNGNTVQRTIVAKSDSLGIVVAFEGTNSSSLISLLHDADTRLVDPDEKFSSVYPPGTQIFEGFQDAYLAVADPVLDKVKELMKKNKESRVTVTGHSMGGALALLAAAHYTHALDRGVFKAFSFGLPRTGNPTFAKAIDSMLPAKFYYTVNGRDCVPHSPMHKQGYQHPSGQVWINSANSTSWKYYPGQENVFGANTIKSGNCSLYDHKGVYYHTALGPNPGGCPAQVGNH